MSQWLSLLESSIHADPLSFGLRAGAIFVVVVGGLFLGRWLQEMVSSFPARIEAARAGELSSAVTGERVVENRSPWSRWLGRFAFICVLLAAALVVLAIVNYGSKSSSSVDPRVALISLVHIAQPIVAVLLLVPLTLAAGRILQRGTIAALRVRVDRSLMLLAGRVVYLAVLIIGALAVLSVLGVPLALPVTFLGVVTLALSLALQDVLRNIFAGVYLLIERPFIIGDEIILDKYAGRVEDIQLRVTCLRAADGQRVLVPNAMLFTSAVINATANERRRTVLAVALPSPSPEDFERAEERITTAIERVKGIRPDPPPQVVLNGAGQSKLDLRVIFWVPGQDRALAQSAISEAVDQVRTALTEADVSVLEPAGTTS